MDEIPVAVLCLAACVFTASAAGKLRSRAAFRAFRTGMRETGLVPGRVLALTMVVLVVAEAATATALLAAAGATAARAPGAAVLAGLALAAAVLLTGVLTLGIAAVMRRGTQAHCACFGAGSGRPLGRVQLTRDIGLLVVLACGLIILPLGHGAGAPGTVVAAGSGVLGALLFIRWDDLADLFVPIPPGAPPITPAVLPSFPRPDHSSR